ncbi:MAG: AraC family transcriptional regulator, partial [Bacillota bacterium]|nr:AraC family transcriptional regulator [Bacillota bacterium]
KLIENTFDSINNNIVKDDININTAIQNKDEFYNNIKQNRINSFSHSTYSAEQKVAETIKNGDTEKAKKLLKQINITPHAKLAQDSIRSYKNSMICSCTFMTRAAIAGGVNPDEAFTLSDTYINKIENIQSLKELEHFESVMVEGFTEMVNSIKTNKYSKSILNAMNYIEDHLCEKIKIKDIAKYSYLNSSYLSDLFHKETNMTISEWILNKRIEEAAFSLIATNEDIADIAFFYQFCSQSYFVKCFKKIKGITPGEYRKNKNKGVN